MTPAREAEIRGGLPVEDGRTFIDAQDRAIMDLLTALDATRAERDAALALHKGQANNIGAMQRAAIDLIADRDRLAADVERLTREAERLRGEMEAGFDADLRAIDNDINAERATLTAENARLAAALAEAGEAIAEMRCRDSLPGETAEGYVRFFAAQWQLRHPKHRGAFTAALGPTDLAAGRDRRVRAGALRDAAERWDAATARDTRRGSAAWECEVRPMRNEVSAWLRAEADRIERGEP